MKRIHNKVVFGFYFNNMARACKLLLVVWLCMNPDARAQNFIMRNDVLKVEVDAGGCINNFVYGDHKSVEFRTDEKYRGPALFLSEKRLVLSETKGSGPNELFFSGRTDTLDVRLNYQLEGNALAAVVTVKNRKPAEIKVPS